MSIPKRAFREEYIHISNILLISVATILLIIIYSKKIMHVYVLMKDVN